jgi:hypothetical protein
VHVKGTKIYAKPKKCGFVLQQYREMKLISFVGGVTNFQPQFLRWMPYPVYLLISDAFLFSGLKLANSVYKLLITAHQRSPLLSIG